jgi:hypothetical protein
MPGPGNGRGTRAHADGSRSSEPFFVSNGSAAPLSGSPPTRTQPENRKSKQQLTEFLNTWDQNLAAQHFLEAALKSALKNTDEKRE